MVVLKDVVLEQQKYLESIRRKELSNMITISGIPTGVLKVNGHNCSTIEDKVKGILQFIGCNESLKYGLLPIKENTNYEKIFVRLKVDTMDMVTDIMNKAKHLKDFKEAKIYINRDTPYYSRKESNRLRKEKAKLIEEHGPEGVKIEKGKLYHHNAVKDQFDLANQLF